MTTDSMIEFLQSAQYKHMMMSMLWATTVCFIALTGFAIVFYARSRSRNIPDDALTLLVATAFDTFLISLLYVALEFTFQADTFRNEAQIIDSSVVIIGQLLSLPFKWLINLFIAFIVLNRVMVLAQWLAERAKEK